MYKYSTKNALICSILDIIILSAGHALNNTLILTSAIIGFCFILLFYSNEFFLPIMLFYLPWSPILKYAPGSFTIYTFIVVGVFLKLILKRNNLTSENRISIVPFLISLLFTILTLSSKLFLNLPIDAPYLAFIFMLFFIPLYVENIKNTANFRVMVLFFGAGVITACVASQILMKYPHMLNYIDVYDLEVNLIRLSGFYGDANFYSAQILAAISGIIIVLSKTNKIEHIIIQILSIVLLIYFGMLSVSKMFILCLLLMIIIWIFSLFTDKRSISIKFGTSVLIIFAILGVLLSGIFSTQINYYLYRFSSVENSSDLTTGRNIIWELYFEFFASKTRWLFLGEGLTISSKVSGKASHNTLLQLLFQCGVIGTILLVSYWKLIIKKVGKIQIGYQLLYVCIAVVACFAPWFALDMIYFDEFFYITLFFIYSLKFLGVGEKLSHKVNEGWKKN